LAFIVSWKRFCQILLTLYIYRLIINSSLAHTRNKIKQTKHFAQLISTLIDYSPTRLEWKLTPCIYSDLPRLTHDWLSTHEDYLRIGWVLKNWSSFCFFGYVQCLLSIRFWKMLEFLLVSFWVILCWHGYPVFNIKNNSLISLLFLLKKNMVSCRSA
jgi:hypothetical protein